MPLIISSVGLALAVFVTAWVIGDRLNRPIPHRIRMAQLYLGMVAVATLLFLASSEPSIIGSVKFVVATALYTVSTFAALTFIERYRRRWFNAE